MSDVTDLNALIEPLATQLTGRAQFLRERGEVKSPQLMEEAAQSLRTLAERQPVKDDFTIAAEKVRDNLKWMAENLDIGEANTTALVQAAYLINVLMSDQAAERQPVGDGEVTQEDRDTAASWFIGYAGNTLEAECMREGTADHWPLVQAFASHRQAAEQRGADRAFEEAAGIAREVIISDWGSAGRQTADSASLAIRQRIGGQ